VIYGHFMEVSNGSCSRFGADDHASGNIRRRYLILLWRDTQTQVGVKSVSGTCKRVLSGMPVFMTETQGPGRLRCDGEAT
jgi:hypothetical protein